MATSRLILSLIGLGLGLGAVACDREPDAAGRDEAGGAALGVPANDPAETTNRDALVDASSSRSLVSAPSPSCPIGWIDSVLVNGVTSTVSGWARPSDPAQSASPQVDLFVDGPPTVGSPLASVLASRVDPSLTAICPSARRFAVSIPTAFVEMVRPLHACVWTGAAHVCFGTTFTTQGTPWLDATVPHAGGRAGYLGNATYGSDWWTRFNDIRRCTLADRAVTAPDALFVGDSITQLWGDPAATRANGYTVRNSAWVPCSGLGAVYDNAAYPGRAPWKAYFDRVASGFDARNGGVSGDTTDGLLFRLTYDSIAAAAGASDVGELDHAALKPKTVVVLIGTNNLFYGDSAAATVFGIRSVINVIRARSPSTNVVLVALTPRTTTSVEQTATLLYGVKGQAGVGESGVDTQLAALFGFGRPSATDAKVTYVDLADQSRGTWARLMTGVPDYVHAPQVWQARELFLAEGGSTYIHPNEAGYAAIAAALRPIVYTLSGKH
jgi:lysophospholipase L1-like esterase